MGEVAKRPISAQCKAELSGGWTCSLRIGQIGGSTSKTTIITVIRIIIIICLPIQETGSIPGPGRSHMPRSN